MLSAGLLALAAAVPNRILTNDHWRRRQPDLVARAQQRIWMWKRPEGWGASIFDQEMEPYLSDPFRGAKQRRVLEDGQTALDLEADAARQCLDAAGLGPGDVDLLICSSFLPDSHGVGGAAFLARELGLRGAAWNLESACSSALVAMRTACALVSSGQHRRVLVVTSCTYSRATADDDPVSWGVGDGATAALIGETAGDAGILGSHSVHSVETCDAVAYRYEVDDHGRPHLRMRTSRHAAKLLRETSEKYLLECTAQALVEAGLAPTDIDHYVFNTPLAGYARFCARTLGVDPTKTLSVYPLYANVGPSLLGLNLLHGAHWRRFAPDDTVLLYTVGSVSSCSAAVVRWGDVALGSLPEGSSLDDLRRLEKDPTAPITLSAVA
ncbi:MAG: 3-oxoacyl-ACP synthase III family protein [Acidobacteriota bacterium]